MSSSVHNPHDHFFGKAFSQPALVRDFIESYLPKTITEQLDLETLTLQPASFIDEALQEQFSDMLYRTHSKEGKPLYIYLLFEHKSYPERLVAYQLLGYLMAIWEQWLTELRELRKQQPRGAKQPLRLIPIIPIVVYHGDKPWEIDKQFATLIDAPAAWAQWLPSFEYLVTDLSTAANEAIVGMAMTRFVLRLLRHAREQTLLDNLPDILSELTHFADADLAMHLLTIGIACVMQVRRDIQVEDYRRALRQARLLPQGEHIMMSLADQLIDQGRQEGLEEGWKKGLDEGRREGLDEGAIQTHRSNILSVLLIRFGSHTTKLEEQLQEIDSAEKLQSLFHAAVSSDTYEAFLEHLTSN